ncbi:MAG: monooxygenase [Polyangiales bacterium]
MQRRALLACFALITSGAACDGSSDEVAASPKPASPLAQEVDTQLTYYKDAKPILEEKCAQCHTKGGMGVFSLETYKQVKPLAAAIKGAVEDGVMPPWRAHGPMDQYQNDRRLTDDQKSKLLGWIDQGAAEGDPKDEPPDLPKGRRGLPRVDLSLKIQEPFTPTDEDTDDYRCFPLDWQFDKTQYVTGLSIEPGNKELVHHGIVYLVSPEGAARVRQNDAADPKLGYECMGGPGSWLTSYEPGGYGEANPGNVAFELRPGSMLVLQMHYNTLRAKGTDRTRVDVMLTEKADRVGSVHLIMNPSWPGRRMAIPANQKDVMHRWEGRPSGLAKNGTYELFWADLHAHTRATSTKMGIIRAEGGELVNLLDIPEYAFDWQETFNFTKPVILHPNDKLYVECIFDNTAENQPIVKGVRQPVKNVNWGERTTDEMCLGNVLADRLPDPEPPAVDSDSDSDSDEDEYEDEYEE